MAQLYTALDTNAGAVIARDQWIKMQRTVNPFDWLNSKFRSRSTVGLKIGSGESYQTAKATAISAFQQNVIPTTDRNNLLRDNTGKMYTKTKEFSRYPYGIPLGLDEFEQSKTKHDLTKEATAALGETTGRLKTDIMIQALSLGTRTVSTASPTAMRQSLRQVDRMKWRANQEGIGTANCTTDADPFDSTITLSEHNVFFAASDGVMDPSSVGAGTFDTMLGAPGDHTLTWAMLEGLPAAAAAREIETVPLTINGSMQNVLFLIVGPSGYNDLVHSPERREEQLYAEVRGMKNSVFNEFPKFLYHAGIVVIEAANRVDTFNDPNVAGDSAVKYPGQTPLFGERSTAVPGWTVTEGLLLGRQCYADSMWKKVTIAESPENDGGTKPWIYSKFIYGATALHTAFADDTKRYRHASVFYAAKDGWNT